MVAQRGHQERRPMMVQCLTDRFHLNQMLSARTGTAARGQHNIAHRCCIASN
jgi:hypothetical protein